MKPASVLRQPVRANRNTAPSRAHLITNYGISALVHCTAPMAAIWCSRPRNCWASPFVLGSLKRALHSPPVEDGNRRGRIKWGRLNTVTLTPGGDSSGGERCHHWGPPLLLYTLQDMDPDFQEDVSGAGGFRRRFCHATIDSIESMGAVLLDPYLRRKALRPLTVAAVRSSADRTALGWPSITTSVATQSVIFFPSWCRGGLYSPTGE